MYFMGIINEKRNELREYTDFIISSFLLKTPMIVVIGSMVLVCAFAVRGGVEVLGRASQLFIPNLIFSYLGNRDIHQNISVLLCSCSKHCPMVESL
ncbi:GerAB/ArcD/ProY family transporter [Neobacillus ginsengisoli]|uniref:GerAB/ArcD/ProY family transporter n=1 Tax=Neobacillus ginsengisoli TaxID=904295 RepID=UPI0027D8D779|nr:GerAB/ArcD/ProY family transporter [Neobacillus ginsengisoli]